MENGTYFAALREALENAQRSVILLGWQFDPRTRLVDDDSGPAAEIGHILRRLVVERPDLEVRLLIWRSPLPIAFSQGFFPQRAQRWFRRKTVDFRLDRARPVGGCHHQKVVVIDDRLAFCGGGDVSVDRWDTPEHLDADPRRFTPYGLPYPPRHEVMMMVDGAAARALGDLARQRWKDGVGEALHPVAVASDPWPASIEADLTRVTVGIARTEPAWRGAAGVRENEALHLEAIARARRLIYLENQYFTSPLIAAALADRLDESDGPEVVIVSTAQSPSWFDHATMDGARHALLERLRRADLHGRFSAWTPRTVGGETIIVHSKVSIIDDTLLRVGSTNLNNRSCGFDTECDLGFETSEDSDNAKVIRGFRARLLAHFLGVDQAVFEATFAVVGSLGKTIEGLTEGRMTPIGLEPASPVARWLADYQLGDPASPADAWRPWRRGRLSRVLKDTVQRAHAAEGTALD
ncbi:MAG: phospholipase [Caulobacteraceae bacterium]|nr:phospholipase [Caulobacteraceae bacterium]